MIFKNVNEIRGAKGKKFFLEKINLFCRLVEVFSERHNLRLVVNSELDNLTIIELTEIGVVRDLGELADLKKVLGTKIYERFVNCINFSITHRRELGTTLDKLNNSKRRERQETAVQNNGFTIVDFFSGAGGLSLGFVQENFQVKLANDYEEVCIKTYQYNHPEVPSDKIIHGDIRNIVDHIEEFIDEEIDVVIGGPPCQGFSSANQQRIIDDPRNELYKYFLRAVQAIAPRFVVMENVKGMLPYASQVIEDYEDLNVTVDGVELHYHVACRILNSHDFGVAQKRQRLIFIAVRNDIDITPDQIFENIERRAERIQKHVLDDAIAYIKPIEAPRIKNMTEIDDDFTGKKVDYNRFEGNENDYLVSINEGREIPFVFNHKARYTNDINYEIYRRLDQGDDATNEKIRDIMPYSHRNHVFKDKYYKLVGNKPSRTITAHLKMDCHSHIHPYQVRSITPREAARIQSFPDDYVFLGAYLKTYMQIGNAVPPLMARAIASEIRSHL